MNSMQLKGFPGGSVVKNLPAMQETCVLSLRQENPLEKEMATHSTILVWIIPWTEEPGNLKEKGFMHINEALSELKGLK